MSWIQKIFTRIFPASWAKLIEADSRLWFMNCLECEFETSYWNLGETLHAVSSNIKANGSYPVNAVEGFSY